MILKYKRYSAYKKVEKIKYRFRFVLFFYIEFRLVL